MPHRAQIPTSAPSPIDPRGHRLPGAARSPLVLLCEHASGALPPEHAAEAHPADLPWLNTHWGVDLGAGPLTQALSAALGAPALLGVVSRLVCDLNRPEDHPELARREVEGHALGFNAALGAEPAGHRARVERWHRPWHAAADALVGAHRRHARLLLSVHSFTPCYLGQRREVEVGVLYDDHEPDALALHAALQARWPGGAERVRLNEPWSGKAGLIYSPARHAQAHGLPTLELELRQDLLETPTQRAAVTAVVVAALGAIGCA